MIVNVPGLAVIDGEWIQSCDGSQAPPLSRLLPRSLYYAGSGIDLEPIRRLWGNTRSFVLCDLRVPVQEVEAGLRHPDAIADFELVFLRHLSAADLELTSLDTLLPVAPAESAHGPVLDRAFGLWAVFRGRSRRQWPYLQQHFSLLHLGGDAAAVYRTLYHTRLAVPLVLAVIQPEITSECLCKPWGALARAVFERSPARQLFRTVAAAPPGLARRILDPAPVRPRFLLTNGSWAHDWRRFYSCDLTAQARAGGLGDQLELWRMPDERMPTPDFERLRRAGAGRGGVT